jgi:secreted PhoX family phosphatase
MLPRGFEYLSFGWRGETMTDGRPTPGAHDGMGAFRDGDRVRLVRNHELRNATPFADGAATHDPLAAGGTTNVFASPSADVLNATDNICVSPRGGIVLCQDGSGMEFMHGLTPAGEIFPFAQNNIVLPAAVMAERAYTGTGDYRGSEWCGATFEPKNGNWLQAHRDPPRSRRPAARGC